MSRKTHTISFYRNRLPHWEVEAGIYFVTIRLQGAIPSEAESRIRHLTSKFRKYHHDRRSKIFYRIFREMEYWLHNSQSVDYLIKPEVAEMVMEAIEHREKVGIWKTKEYVLMPNHLHILINMSSIQKRGITLKKTLEDFKSWTGRNAVMLLGISGSKFWQREWFDHWSRSVDEDKKFMKYIRENPVTAGLEVNYEHWPYGSWAKSKQ